jgi:integrase
MPRVKLTKGVIDDLPTTDKDVVYWDAACPGFGVKVTPAGRKAFVVLFRTGGAGSKLRKYTIGPYGRVTLHQARVSARVIIAARQIGGPYGGIVELLALTGQRREEAARCVWDEIDLQNRIWTLPSLRTKNAKPHIVHLSDQAVAVLIEAGKQSKFAFSVTGTLPFQDFSKAKRALDAISGVTDWRLHDLRRTCVSGMASLGVAPHVADKILNHQSGTISGVAAVYQRHQFLAERKGALEKWGDYVSGLLTKTTSTSERN